MEPADNIKLLAIKLGEILKTETTVNQVERVAAAVFPFEKAPHPNPAITSRIAKIVYDWLMTLDSREEFGETEKIGLIRQFVIEVAPALSRARELVGIGEGEIAPGKKEEPFAKSGPLSQEVAPKGRVVDLFVQALVPIVLAIVGTFSNPVWQRNFLRRGGVGRLSDRILSNGVDLAEKLESTCSSWAGGLRRAGSGVPIVWPRGA